jgi:flagellar biosynthetic protein FliO
MKSVFLFIISNFLLKSSFIESETNLTETATLTPPDFYFAAVKAFSILFIILAAILTAFYLIKRFWPKASGLMGNDSWIKVIAATYIAPKKMVVLVEVAGETLVLGLTGDHITMLTKVANEQMIHHLKASQEKKATHAPFYQTFRSLVNKYGYEREKGESLFHKIRSNLQKNSKAI